MYSLEGTLPSGLHGHKLVACHGFDLEQFWEQLLHRGIASESRD